MKKKASRIGSPLAVSLVYGLLASLWILTSDWLLQLMPSAHPASDTVKGLLFVAVTSVLLFSLTSVLYRERRDSSAEALEEESHEPLRGGRVALGVVGLLVAIALAASGIFRLQAPQLIDEARDDLSTEAELKAGRVAQWLRERAGDAHVLQSHFEHSDTIAALLADPDSEPNHHDRHHLQALQTAYQYESIVLLTPDGTRLLAMGKEMPLDHETRKRLAALSDEVERLPLTTDEDGHTHLDWLVPIQLDDDPSPEAAFLLRSAPSEQLFPLLRHDHGELDAVLVRPTGDELVHLTIPSRTDATARIFDHPIDETPFPRGTFGPEATPRVVEGDDYRGTAIVAAIHPIDNSDWSLIVKDTRASILEPLYTLIAWVSVIGFFVMVVIAGMTTLLWRKSQQNYRLWLANRSARQDRLLRSFYDLPFIGMSITSASNRRIERVNPRMGEMLGRPTETLVGENWCALVQDEEGCFPPESPAVHDLIEGRIDHYRTDHRLTRPDGSEAILRFEVRATRAPDGEAEYLIATAEDITAQEQAADALRHQKDLYDFLSQTNQAVTRCRTPQELFEKACAIAVENGHLAFAWIGLIDEPSGAVEPVAQYGDRSGYIDQIEVSVNSWEPAGQGPVGRCIRSGRLEVIEHFQSAEESAPWHDQARTAEIDAVAAFPIVRQTRVIGAMALYAREGDFFDSAIRETVNDLASDLSFAMDHMDRLSDLSRAREAVQISPSVLFRWRPEPGWPVEYVSENIHRWGYDASQWDDGQAQFAEYVHPEDVSRIAQEIAEYTEAGQPEFLQEYRLRMANGSYRWFEDVTRIEFDPSGKVVGYAGVLTDINDRHRIEEHERLMAQVIENTREGVIITDQDHVIVEVNPAFTNLTGYSAEEAIGRRPAFLQSGQHDRHFFRRMWSALEQQGHWQGEIWNRRKNGETYPELLSISRVTDRDGNITHYVGLFLDISRQKENESKLEYLANHDALTGLPNRAQLISRMQHLLTLAEQHGDQGAAVLMVDLDRFKDVNDSLGHAAGDQLLIKVADRLTRAFPQADMVARLSGDEFAMVMTGLADDSEVGRIAEQLVDALGDPWELPNGQQVRVMASVGISLYPRFANTAHALLQQADTALYRAKEEGRGTFRYFSDEMTNAARDRIALELDLRQAIDNDQLRLVFQPQISLEDGSLQGAEVLVRWQHPTEGLISPARFIPVAETTGLIWPLGRWVLEEACRIGRQWLEQGLDFGRLAVNVSAHQLRQGEVDALVQRILTDTGLPADRLELELTESAIVRREAETRELLARLREMGVHVALDDFGTGYSSLGQLREFAIDVLKIDKRFIDLIEQPDDRGQIARVIIDLGHTLGLKVLAEGVENAVQHDFLVKHHCDVYQGYLASRPLPADQFVQRYLADSPPD